jgi:hypothetical protein
MGTVYATLLGLCVLSGLFIRAKTARLLPIAMSGGPLRPAQNNVRMRKSHDFAAHTANEVNQ